MALQFVIISNKYSSPQNNAIDKFWFQILSLRFSCRYQFGTQWLPSLNHSYNFNQSFNILFFILQFVSLGDTGRFLYVVATIYWKHVFVVTRKYVRENYPTSESFLLVIFVELSQNQTIMLLQCSYQSYKCPLNFDRVEAFMNSSESFIG